MEVVHSQDLKGTWQLEACCRPTIPGHNFWLVIVGHTGDWSEPVRTHDDDAEAEQESGGPTGVYFEHR